MKRKTNKSPTCLLTADWHIRGDRPVCRTDDYMEAQKKKIEFIFSLANKHNCPILIAGDIGNRPIWGDKLLNWFIDIVSPKLHDNVALFSVAGQHDLLNHRLDKHNMYGIGVISKAINNMYSDMFNSTFSFGLHTIIYSFPYSIKLKQIIAEEEEISIALCHMMVIKSQKDKLWEAQEAQSAKRLLKKFPCYDLIVSGDNHQSFVVEYEGRILVNPGSLMRMSADQIDHQPSVYLWYAEDNSIERVYLPIEKDVINTFHLEEVKDRNTRIESFINRLKDTEEMGLSFEKNMEEFFKTNRQRKRVVEKVWEATEL